VIINAWRIVKPRRVKTAFTGDGAKETGGRWNHQGTAVVYTAESLPLAMREAKINGNLQERVVCLLDIPSELVVPVPYLPLDWKQEVRDYDWSRTSVETQKIGDNWIRQCSSVAMRVPSVKSYWDDAPEFNYLLNPSYPDFLQKITIYPFLSPELFLPPDLLKEILVTTDVCRAPSKVALLNERCVAFYIQALAVSE